MAKLESLQKRIDKIDRSIRYIQNIILALLTGIVWSIYALMESKVDNKIVVLSGVGVVALIFFVTLWVKESNREDELIEELEKE